VTRSSPKRRPIVIVGFDTVASPTRSRSVRPHQKTPEIRHAPTTWVTPGDAARGAPSPSPRLESPLPRAQRMQPDQAYERVMPIALQLIEAP